MKKVFLFLILGLFFISFISANTFYTPTTDTTCIGNICTKTISSGLRNIYEDDTWKSVDEARSLKGKGFEVTILENDDEFPVEVVDFNSTSIKVKLNPKGIKVFGEDIPVRIWNKNEEKEQMFQEDLLEGRKESKGIKDYKNKMDKVKEEVLGFWFLNQEETKTYDFTLGSALEFGHNSTVIILSEADTENLGDTEMDKDNPSTTDGAGVNFGVGANSSQSARYYGALKFNISSIPVGVVILNANLTLVTSVSGNFDTGDSLNITLHHLFSSFDWVEEDLDFDTLPTTADYNTTTTSSKVFNTSNHGGNGFRRFNVTDIIKSSYNANEKNVSIFFNSTLLTGTFSASERITFRTKENGVSQWVPSLTIEYATPLDINITSPLNTTLTTEPTSLDWTIGGDLEVDCKYSDDLGATNTSVTCTDLTTAISPGQGNATFFMWANDSLGSEVSSNVTFFVDSIDPSVSIIVPTGEFDSFTLGNFLDLNWTINDTNLESCWFDYNNINTTVTCGDGNTTFAQVGSIQSLIMWANDTLGNTGFDVTNWTYAFVENDITFTQNATETSSQTFVLNMTTDLTILSISAVLDYNGTSFPSTASCIGTECLLTSTINLPLIQAPNSETHDFFWNFTIFNGTDSIERFTSTNTQNVSRIFIEKCDGTFTTQTLNFTAFDERNLSRIIPFQFDATFVFWAGDGSVTRNSSLSISDNEVNLCLSPDDATFNTTASIVFDEVANSVYDFKAVDLLQFPINNVSQDLSLYLLESSLSTSFILIVQDENLLPVRDALIEILRFYPGEGIFRVVQTASTDDNGKTVGFFETETVDYKFIIRKNGVILLETNTQKIVVETSPPTLTFNTGEDLGEPWSSQIPLGSYNSSLTWDQDTGIVTYVYIDSSSNFTEARLWVQKTSLVNSSAYITICNDTSALSASVITCNVGNSSGFYLATTFNSRSPETFQDQISFLIETFSGAIGQYGLFFGWFLILIASFLFKFNEIAGIWGVTVTVFLINLLGLITFGAVFVSAIIGIAMILTWLMAK